jgi:amino acid transporter
MDRPGRIAVLATAIPIGLLAISTIIIGVLGKETYAAAEGLTTVDICLQVILGLAGVAILSSVVLAIRRKREIAKGMGIVSGIGFVVWVIIFIALSVYFEG